MPHRDPQKRRTYMREYMRRRRDSQPRLDPSLTRLRQARQTLLRLCHDHSFPGAVGQPDPSGVFFDAARNVAAYIQWRDGDEAWRETLEE